MSDFQQFSRSPSGGLVFDRPFLPSFNPDLSTIREENWAVAEETAQQVVLCVHPTLDTEEKRKDVIEYVQRLIRTSLGCEVFPYGSVPLKTYLPDGDIDLTALSSPAAEETLAHDVLAVLQAEEKNPNAEYEVKDTQFIDAEVKLVKCLVQNIVIDISFNQLGGLCTLCFLEQVDRLVAKNHLFKRSIILIKTWCYYESRILGAHHGLISTYAMETLVLYIFHVFHASLGGPLAVLYRFLDYFSKFDWENLCISLKGPVSKSSLPDIVVDMTHSVQNDYMLSEEFLRNCIDMFSVPSRGVETQQRAFPQKHLNIIDPLKDNNNLGRSVNRGNFYRIRSAFRYGALKLGRILMLPRERIADEMKRFYANTLERLGRNGGNIYPAPHFRSFSEEKIQFNSLNLDLENNVLGGDFELDRYSTKINPLPMVSKMSQSMDEIGVSVCHPADEMNSRLVNYTFDCSAPAWYVSDSVSKYNAPSFHFSESFVESTKFDDGMLNEEKSPNAIDEKVDIDSLMVDHKDNLLGPCDKVCYYSNNYEGMYSSGSGIMSPDGFISEDLALDFREKDLVDISGSPENSNPLSDLSGDYDSHIRSLLYGQCCHGYALFAPVIPNPPTFVSQFESQRPWSTVRQSMPMKQNSSSHIKENSLNLGQTTNPTIDSAQSKSALCWEEEHKSRGTGTYFPNGCLCIERPSRGRGRNRVHGNQRQFQRNARNIGPAPSVPEKKSFKEGKSHEQLPKAQSPVIRHEKSELPKKFTSSALDNSRSSTFALSLDKLEFGSLGHLSDDNHSQASGTTSGWASTPRLVALEVQNSEPLFGSNHERVGNKSYRLKDEDFPPLTV